RQRPRLRARLLRAAQEPDPSRRRAHLDHRQRQLAEHHPRDGVRARARGDEHRAARLRRGPRARARRRARARPRARLRRRRGPAHGARPHPHRVLPRAARRRRARAAVTLRPAAFLDRDGVLNRRPPPHDYVRSAEALELLPGVAGAVDALRAAGFATVVVSNQRGLARGLLTPETLAAIERRLAEAGVRIDAYYYCPHDLADGCDCRKPAPGLLLRAAAE